MATIGYGSITRILIEVDNLGETADGNEQFLSDAYNEDQKKGVDISVVFYIRGQKAKFTLPALAKSDLQKQYDEDPTDDSNIYMALLDTNDFTLNDSPLIGAIAAEITVTYFDNQGNKIVEVFTDVSTGVTTKMSA